MDNDQGVTIFDGRTRLRLIPAGEPGLGFPTRIQIECGPFFVSVEGETRIDQQFRQSLERLHETMKGEALLTVWNEEHSLLLTGQGTGPIKLVANIIDGSGPRRGRLIVEMLLDQSYLPGIIAEIARYFPAN
jgi:hypothetical protein